MTMFADGISHHHLQIVGGLFTLFMQLRVQKLLCAVFIKRLDMFLNSPSSVPRWQSNEKSYQRLEE